MSEQVLVKEFKQMMAQRASAITPIPLTDLLPMREEKISQNYGYVKGINDQLFLSLEGTLCTIVYRQKVLKPQYTSEGKIRKDADGKKVEDYVPVPRECVLIKSEVDIMKSIPEGVVYEDREDFMFILSRKERKVITEEVATYYYYIIPRKYIFEVNMNALVISRNRRKNVYSAYQIALQDGTYLFASVVPLPRNLENVAVMVLHPSVDFKPYMGYLFGYLREKGFLYTTELGILEDGTNITCMELEPTLQEEIYKPLGSLIKQHSEELE